MTRKQRTCGIENDDPTLGQASDRAAELDKFQRRQDEILQRYRAAEQPLLEELRTRSVFVQSVWQLSQQGEPYPDVIPILLKHLARPYPPNVRYGIAIAISKRWAREQAWNGLIEAYKSEPNLSRIAPLGEIGAPSEPKEAMAEGLSLMAHSLDLDELIGLASDPLNGPSRVLFVKNLARSKQSRALDVLARLSRDPDLKAEIEFRLKSKLRRQAKKEGRGAAKL
jgi:hypothetical protein